MSIYKLKPAYKDDLWGGSRLKKDFGKSEYHGYVLAETWELSFDPSGLTTIRNGEYKGKTVKELFEECGEAVSGTNYSKFHNFPLSIKFIDARQNLSIKLHPKDEYADEKGLLKGNDECWYIVDRLPNAGIFYGLEHDLTKEEFRQKIEDNTLMKELHFQPVNPGEIYFLPSGILHSIGAGVLAAEIKQSEQVKYRVYDFGRVKPDGQPRELMIDDAVNAAILKAGVPKRYDGDHLVKCDTFTLDKVEIDGEVTLKTDGTTFHHLLTIDGEMILKYGEDRMEILKGDGILISADQGEYTLKGKGTLLKTTI